MLGHLLLAHSLFASIRFLAHFARLYIPARVAQHIPDWRVVVKLELYAGFPGDVPDAHKRKIRDMAGSRFDFLVVIAQFGVQALQYRM